MDTSPISKGGIQALQAAQQQINQSASKLASEKSFEPSNQLQTQELVKLKDGEHNFNAAAKLVKAEDEILGTIINTSA